MESIEATTALQMLSTGEVGHGHSPDAPMANTHTQGLPSLWISVECSLTHLHTATFGGCHDPSIGNQDCGCAVGLDCNCFSDRTRPSKAPPPAQLSGPPKQYRAVLPRPPAGPRRLSDASLSSGAHDPSHPHGHVHSRGNSFYSPYGRAYEYAAQSTHAPGQSPGLGLSSAQTSNYMEQSGYQHIVPAPPSATSESSIDDFASTQSLGIYQPPPPSGFADAQSQFSRVSQDQRFGSNGRAQPHHEAPFAPPQTPTDLPLPAWPQTLQQSHAQSFSALGVGVRPDHSAIDGYESLQPSLGRGNMWNVRFEQSQTLCGCGPTCQCPGCVEHAGGAATSNAYDLCANPSSCAACLQCSILALPNAPSGDMDQTREIAGQGQDMNMQDLTTGMSGFELPQEGEGYGFELAMDMDNNTNGSGMMNIDEWLRSVAPESTPGQFQYGTELLSPDRNTHTLGLDFGVDEAPPPPSTSSGHSEGAPSPILYDSNTFDPAILAAWEAANATTATGGPRQSMDVLPDLFLPEVHNQGYGPAPGQWRGPGFDEDVRRMATFATSTERMASASTSSLSSYASSYTSSIGEPLLSSPSFAPTFVEPETLPNPELLVIPPTPALRAGSGLGMSRSETIDAVAENARYLNVHQASYSSGLSPISAGSPTAATHGSDGSGSSSRGSSRRNSHSHSGANGHGMVPSGGHAQAQVQGHARTDSLSSAQSVHGSYHSLDAPVSAHGHGHGPGSGSRSDSGHAPSSSSASMFSTSGSMLSGISRLTGASRLTGSSSSTGKSKGSAQSGHSHDSSGSGLPHGRGDQQQQQQHPGSSKGTYNPFNSVPGFWGSRFAGKF
jgi:hypothetical protein